MAQQIPVRSQSSSPEITAGHYVPLIEENLARPLRYTPHGTAVLIRNGKQFFNRPLYGPNIPFRCDGGDLPEFSLYLPGHGGNLRLGFAESVGAGHKWLHEFESVVCTYEAGRLVYRLSDPLLGSDAELLLEVLTVGAAVWLRIETQRPRHNLDLVWAFGGVSGRKGKRSGDIGCEVEPVNEFFQLRSEECRGNVWTLPSETVNGRVIAHVDTAKIALAFDAPGASVLQLGAAEFWNQGWDTLWAKGNGDGRLPVLLGRCPLFEANKVFRITVLNGAVQPLLKPSSDPMMDDRLDEIFRARRDELKGIAERVSWSTPDSFLDGVSGALGIAADALWDEHQGCVMHGAVAWRQALAGWRGPYALDVMGHHDRMRQHLRHWIAKQNISSVDNGSGGVTSLHGFTAIREAEGTPDSRSGHTRSEDLLHSNGDLSHNHYDMNLVFFDALLRHLCWTGDMEFAREAWPALERHAAWERRLFRREYGAEGATLPLYEAYAAIWASDNLQYNGGGATHSSAYSVYLNRRMAELGRLLQVAPEVIAAYEAEADAIEHAMQKLLWMEDRGAFAESIEWFGERKLAVNPAVWTMYQAIDSEVGNRKQQWQMAAERLRALRKIPIVGEGVPKDAGWQIACSDWQPYVWSLTLLVLAENLATALALFQAGLGQMGYELLRGSLIDAGYRGLCPGNFPMSLQLDPHRQESQRDFGDPIGCAARAIVEGLWGVRPDLLGGRLRLVPQLPPDWEEAALQHPEFLVTYKRRGGAESWYVEPRFAKSLNLSLELPARTVDLPSLTINGQKHDAHFVPDAVGTPRLQVEVEAAGPWAIELQWHGKQIVRASEVLHCVKGQAIQWPEGIQHDHIDDPQHCLSDGRGSTPGEFCVFALQARGAARYWLPIELQIEEEAPIAGGSERKIQGTRFESVDIGDLFSGSAREIFTRNYQQPRSKFCSLNLPDTLLGGWANFDAKAWVDDSGLRNSGGHVAIPNGVFFSTPGDRMAKNCCFVSQWSMDRKSVQFSLRGRASKLHLLLMGTTFPQATGASHARIGVSYRVGEPISKSLRSPESWWPVEQDYELDDYVFRIGKGELPWRVDLYTGQVRKLARDTLRGRGGQIRGGAAFTVEVDLDPHRELEKCEISCELYGVVLGLLAVTLERG